MIEIVQEFREFKPYLTKRLAFIRESGRTLELQEEVDDIEFYLEAMKDILADESHGVDQIRGFIDKIHDMIRKNPLTELPNERRALDAKDEFDDNDRPPSPSSTHGAHRTVEVNFSSRNDHSQNEETYDEWGRSTLEFTRRDPWSEEIGGANCGGLGRGLTVGRGAAPVSHHQWDDDRQYHDIRHNGSRGRGRYNDNDYERRSDHYLDRNPSRDSSKGREQDLKPDWLTDGHSNGNNFEEGWRNSMIHSETLDRDEQMHSAQLLKKNFERRRGPSAEPQRGERPADDYISMFDQLGRNDDRMHESAHVRHDMNSSHSEYGHGPQYPLPNTAPSLLNHVTSIPSPQAPYYYYGIPPPQSSPHFNNAPGLLGPPAYPSVNTPLLLVPNAATHVWMGLGIPNVPTPNTMNFQQAPPPSPNYQLEHYPGVLSSSPNYASPLEPSADEMREITMMKARKCFRSPSGSSTTGATLRMTRNSTLDPRLNRKRPVNHHTVPSQRANNVSSSRPDAVNVPRPSTNPIARSRIELERKKLEEIKERMRQQEGNKKSNNNRGSKIQELRKQVEREGLHRLGRPAPTKPVGSFEDAVTANVEESDLSDISNASSKSGEKPRSSSSGKLKETEGGGRQSRSRGNKTGRSKKETSQKKNKSGERNKSKDKANNKSAENDEKKKGKVPAKRVTKRKSAKVNPRKRTKKSGPITKAQAAIKKKDKEVSKFQPDETAEKSGVTARKKKKANSMILRHLAKGIVYTNDTVVNKGLCKIKLECDFLPQQQVKTEPTEVDPFLNASSSGVGVNNELEDQFANTLDNDFASILDQQTEDHMDLDEGEICVQNFLEINYTNPPSGDMAFEAIDVNVDTNVTTIFMVDNDVRPQSDDSINTTTLPMQTTVVDKTIVDDVRAPVSQNKEDAVSVASIAKFSQSNENSDVASGTKESSSKDIPSEKANDNAKIISNSEDDSCSLPSSSSIVPPIKSEPDANDDLRIKSELMDSSSDFPEMDDLRKDVFSNKCDNCNFSGQEIVEHYPCKIPQACFTPETINGLLELNTSESPELLEIIVLDGIWPCLYCGDRYNCIIDFYDHLTSHTGEFRYVCGECETSFPYKKSLVNHVKSHHEGISKNCIRVTFESVIQKASRELSGFLCSDCFYFQLRFENIIRHIQQTGHSSLDFKCVRFICPSTNTSAESTADNANSAAAKVPKLPSESTATKGKSG